MSCELELRVEIVSRDGAKRYAYNYGLPRLTIEDLQPSRCPPTDPQDFMREHERRERLTRYTNLMTADVAHAFTEFMLKDRP